MKYVAANGLLLDMLLERAQLGTAFDPTRHPAVLRPASRPIPEYKEAHHPDTVIGEVQDEAQEDGAGAAPAAAHDKRNWAMKLYLRFLDGTVVEHREWSTLCGATGQPRRPRIERSATRFRATTGTTMTGSDARTLD